MAALTAKEYVDAHSGGGSGGSKETKNIDKYYDAYASEWITILDSGGYGDQDAYRWFEDVINNGKIVVVSLAAREMGGASGNGISSIVITKDMVSFGTLTKVIELDSTLTVSISLMNGCRVKIDCQSPSSGVSFYVRGNAVLM